MNMKTRLRRWANKSFAWIIIPLWRLRGSPIPVPHALKQRILRDFAYRFGATRLVETGTYRGDMVAAMLNDFREIHTIEVFPPLYAAAVDQFKYDTRVHVHLGNSADVLVELAPLLDGVTLFWLDGHYSGEGTGGGAIAVPVMGELAQIKKTPGRHIILIDDAREFSGENGYPTLEQIRDWAKRNGYEAAHVEDDVIRLVPQPAGAS